MLSKVLVALNSEEGHAATLPPIFVAMTGAILLAVGAVNDQNVLTIIGGVVLAVGILAAALLQHMAIEYDIYDRLDKLEGKE